MVIEAQLGQSNHDHLGKLITYCAVYQADVAVWIVSDARPEHLEAINLLNQGGVAEFFLVKLESVSVGGSPSAPLLTLITGPTAELKTAGKVKAEMKASDARRIGFWAAFLPEAATIDPRFGAKKARPIYRMGVATQRLGIRYVVGLRQHSCAIELVVYPGKKQTFGAPAPVLTEIQESASSIQGAMAGAELEWLYGNRPRLRVTVAGGCEDQASWQETIDTAIQTLQALVSATQPVLAKLTSRPAVGPAAQDAEDEEYAGSEEG